MSGDCPAKTMRMSGEGATKTPSGSGDCQNKTVRMSRDGPPMTLTERANDDDLTNLESLNYKKGGSSKDIYRKMNSL